MKYGIICKKKIFLPYFRSSVEVQYIKINPMAKSYTHNNNQHCYGTDCTKWILVQSLQFITMLNIFIITCICIYGCNYMSMCDNTEVATILESSSNYQCRTSLSRLIVFASLSFSLWFFVCIFNIYTQCCNGSNQMAFLRSLQLKRIRMQQLWLIFIFLKTENKIAMHFNRFEHSITADVSFLFKFNSKDTFPFGIALGFNNYYSHVFWISCWQSILYSQICLLCFFFRFFVSSSLQSLFVHRMNMSYACLYM